MKGILSPPTRFGSSRNFLPSEGICPLGVLRLKHLPAPAGIYQASVRPEARGLPQPPTSGADEGAFHGGGRSGKALVLSLGQKRLI